MLSLLCVAAADAQGDSIVRDLQRVDVVARGKNDAVRATIPMQRIDAEKMRLLGIHSLTDALKHFAGTTVRDYGGAGGMKTVSVRGIGARHTAVVYDGIALSDCQTGEIDLSRFSLEQFGSLRLEIGDGDNIFQPARNQAAAATLVMESSPDITHQSSPITHSPSPFGEGWGGALNVGSFGLVSPSVRLSQPLSEKLALSAFGEFFHADNDYPFTLHNVTLTSRERRTNSRMNTGRGELNLHWMPSASVQLSAKGYFYHSHRHLPGIVRYYTNENHERLTDQNAFGQVRLRAQLAERWALLLNAKFDRTHTDYENRTPGSALGDARYWQRESYGSAALLFEPTPWLSLDYSADFQRNTLNSTLSIYDEHPRRNLFLQSFAAKAQWPRLTLVARALWSIANESERENHSSFDPSLSLSYRLLPRPHRRGPAAARACHAVQCGAHVAEIALFAHGRRLLQPRDGENRGRAVQHVRVAHRQHRPRPHPRPRRHGIRKPKFRATPPQPQRELQPATSHERHGERRARLPQTAALHADSRLHGHHFVGKSVDEPRADHERTIGPLDKHRPRRRNAHRRLLHHRCLALANAPRRPSHRPSLPPKPLRPTIRPCHPLSDARAFVAAEPLV